MFIQIFQIYFLYSFKLVGTTQPKLVFALNVDFVP